jgi:hypothetical protein
MGGYHRDQDPVLNSMRATPFLCLTASIAAAACAVQPFPPLTTPAGAETVWIESLGLE